LPIYESFAETVRFILEKAISANAETPRPQSIQVRAKGIQSLRRRLAENGRLDTQTLETDRRDLAGARLIFYTNTDVDRFLRSRLILDNFKIEEDSTKIHHPTPESKDSKYRAIHYTVRLREDRTKLPEYARFAGFRCEIQIQTILEHAWAETSHDIVYKPQPGNGYGTKAGQAIRRRFERIMDEYLLPAGFEIQKAQQEYERLIQGKELFDKDVVKQLDGAQNNNERYEVLTGLRDYAIPHYDDVHAAYKTLQAPLLRTARAARATEPAPFQTTFGDLPGFRADTVVKLIIEIIERLRYADVTGTLQLLIDIYRGEPDADIRQQIVSVVKNLAEYNLDAYRQVGSDLQRALVEHIGSMSATATDSIRPIAIAVWAEALQSDITGTKWKADSMVMRTGALPASEQLRAVRDIAMQALFNAYDTSTDDSQRRSALTALDSATRTPTNANYPNELLATTVRDAKRIVDFVRERAPGMSFELLQHLEHQFLYDYFRTRQLVTEDRFGCQAEAATLVHSILAFRNAINKDQDFVKYKVLVGFESVYPAHWEDESFDFHSEDAYRRAEADRFIEEITPENEHAWFRFIERCSGTKSNDMATFPVFGAFLGKLSELKPEVAARLLSNASEDLRHFVPGFLNGLARSARSDIYAQVLEAEIRNPKSLNSLARHFRYGDVVNPAFVTRVLKSAIDADNPASVIECLLFAVQHYGTDKIADSDSFVRDALTYLNTRQDARWIHEGWYFPTAEKFFELVSPERIFQLLENLGYLSRIEYHAERILAHIAKRVPEQVWDYFGARLQKEFMGGDDIEEKFEAAPFEFHELNKVLCNNPDLGIRKGLEWFQRDPKLFQFRGGRIISNAFQECTPEFSAALADLVKRGDATETDFALAVLPNYNGNASTHAVLKEVVARFPKDEGRLDAATMIIDNTGAVSGDLGFAEAWRARKSLLEKWLLDDRDSVREFARKHMARLDLLIASEHRQAESRREMRKRDFEDDDGEELS
jgi:ppGpp synthetase/RelA/SpoT-type nucleotidyltranferase